MSKDSQLMCTYCGWTQHVDNLDGSLLFQQSYNSVLTSWKKPVTGLQVQRSHILDCCHGPKEVYTEWCNISYRPFLPLSLPPAIPSSLFFSFLSPQCNLIRLDCPLATSPSGHVALYPLPTPRSPFLYTDSSGVEVVWLMSSNPISQCSRPSPAGGFSHAIQPDQSEWPPLCILITVSENENTFANHRPAPASSGTVKIMLAIICR